MSEFTNLIFQVGERVGWDFILLVSFTYELFWPERLHYSGGTKLQRLLKQPNEAVVAALEAVYKEHDDLSQQKLIDIVNGDAPRSWDFTAEDINRRPGGD